MPLKQVKNNARYINSTMRFFYESKVLKHAQRFRKPDKNNENLLQTSH